MPTHGAGPEQSKTSHSTLIPESQQTAHPHNTGSVTETAPPPGAGGTQIKEKHVPALHSGKWFDDHLLTGDWFGTRHKILDSGVEFHGATVTDLLGNVTGGFSQGWEPAASTDIGMILDLEKLVGWPGASFETSFIWRVGNNLSATRIGNLLTVAQLYGGQNLRLYALFLKQEIIKDELYLKLGRFGAFDDFLTTPINWNFINNGFDGNAKGIFLSIPAFGLTVYPTSSWGAFAKYSPKDEEWYIQTGVYSLSERNGRNASSGINFGFDADRGVAALLQGGWYLNQDPGNPELPGKYSLGFAYSSFKLPTFAVPRESEWNLYSLYMMAEQMVYREPGEENLQRQPSTWGWGGQEGLTLFTEVVGEPQTDLAFFPIFINTGFTYQGPIPGREMDFVAGGFTFGLTGDELRDFQREIGVPVQTFEMVAELNYRISITPYFYVQPGMQYVFRPNANGTVPDALVLGGQIGVLY
ncbi:MAG: carbohydrate porin [Verrucomicrobiota bacterium]